MKNKKVKNSTGLKMLLKYYLKHWFHFFFYIFILLCGAVLSFFDAMFIAKTITAIMDEGAFDLAIVYAGISLALMGTNYLLGIFNTYFFKELENLTKIDIQQNILKNALDIQMCEYDKMASGVIVTRLTADIDRLSNAFREVSPKIVDILTKIAYVAYIFFLNVWLGLFMLGMIVVTSTVYVVRVYFLKKLKPGVYNAAESVNSKIIEVVRGVKDIKTLNCADNTMNLLYKDQLVYKKRDNSEYYVGISLHNFEKILEHVFKFLFIALCVFFLRMDALTPIIFYTCFLYKDHIFDFASLSGDLYYRLEEIGIYANRIFRLAEPDEYKMDEFGECRIKDFQGKITFNNVKFSYSNAKPVLRGATFEILPKQTVAFVGESGCGKSTIINLIAHLYYKNSGELLLDDVPIENLSKDFIKENIAVVNQFPYIFNISIRENFKLIKNDITDDEIYSLCKETRILSHIKKLPNGLDTVIGENGGQFSGGQRQKLCIARALARNVKILIFDEATSSLDNKSQNEIMKVIEALKSKMTIILIAHRLSTITYADCIYLLKDGMVFAKGTHDELFNDNEYYRQLYINALIVGRKEQKEQTL